MNRLIFRVGRRYLSTASSSSAISRARSHLLSITGYNVRSDDLLRMVIRQQAKEEYQDTRRLALIGDMALKMAVLHNWWASGRGVSMYFAT